MSQFELSSTAYRNLHSTRERFSSFDGNRTDFPGSWMCGDSDRYKGMPADVVGSLMDLTMAGKLDWFFVPWKKGQFIESVCPIWTEAD